MMIYYYHPLHYLLVLTLSFYLFNACSGAAFKRAEILRSISSNLETADSPPEVSDEEAEKILIEDTQEETESEPDDPEEFNYFPYDLQLDTIAYMSCENNNFFTFKAGAYFERSGLRLSEYFLRKTNSMSQGALRQLIESSTKYQAFPYFSFATSTNFTSTLTHAQFPLRLHRFITDLINTGNTRLRVLSDENNMEARFSYGIHAATYAKGLNGNYRLLLSYKGGRENKTLHKEGGDWGVDVYGRVYEVQLNRKITSTNLSRYVLSSVSERKLPENLPQTQWICPSALQFEVRRNENNAFEAQKMYDVQNAQYKKKYPSLSAALNAEDANYRIPPDEPLCSSSSGGGTALAVARAVLGNNWDINANSNRKCISPKDPTDLCYLGLPDRSRNRLAAANQECDATVGRYCPHFLSICIRKN